MMKLLTNRNGVSLIEVAASGFILSLSLYYGLLSHRENLDSLASLRMREAITAAEKEIQGLGLQVANDFYRRIILDSTGAVRSPSGCTDVPYASEPFIKNSGVVSSGSGIRLELFDRSRMTIVGGTYTLPGDIPSLNPKYVAAKARCAGAQTVYDTNVLKRVDLSSQKEIFWCMRLSTFAGTNPQSQMSALSTMDAVIEFKFTPLDVQTGQALSCSEVATKKNFAEPEKDLVVGALYYSVYWSSTNSKGKIITADFSNFIFGGGI